MKRQGLHFLLGMALIVGATTLVACDSDADSGAANNNPSGGDNNQPEPSGTVAEQTCAILQSALTGPLVEADNSGRVLVYNIDYPQGWRRDGFGAIFSPQRDFGDGNTIAINMQQKGAVADPDAYFQQLIDLFQATDVGEADYGNAKIRIMRQPGDGGHYTLLPHGDTHVELWIAHGGTYDDSECPDAIYQLKERLLQTLRPNLQTTFGQ